LPRKIDPWILLGRAWIRKARQTSDPGYHLNANACVDLALDVEPEAAVALNLRGLVLLDAHRFEEARALAQSMIDKKRDEPMAWGTLSDAFLEMGEVEQADRAAEEMINLKPGLPSYSRNAYLKWLRGEGADAKEFMRLAIDAGGSQTDREPLAWVLVQAAMLFWHKGDYEGADVGFKQAFELVKGYPPALVGRGRAAMARGAYAEAAGYLNEAFAKSPLTETAWLLSDALAGMNDAAGAEDAFKKAETAGRSDPRTLSLLYAVKQRNCERALTLAQEEMKVRKDIYTVDAFAWSLFRLGKLAEAEDAIGRVTRLGTKDARLLYHRGAIQIARGEVKQGKALVNEALALNPRFDETEAKDARALSGG
jgi:tetratricopeptide (TPR) repeat protein